MNRPRSAPTERLGPDLRRLIAGLDAPVLRIEEITGLPSPVLARRTFRVALTDGRVLKGRRLEDEQHAVRMVLLRTRLPDDRFSRIVAAGGAAVLEEWVSGRDLTEADAVDPALLRWCGETLAVLHSADPPRRIPGTWSLSMRQTADELTMHLRALVETRSLGRRLARRLRQLAAEHRPVAASLVIVHRDLWWRNVVRTDGGDWRVVDNASLNVAAAALDIARTRHLWPMSGGGWAAFLAGYATAADAAVYLDHALFWDIVVLAEVATFRRGGRTAGVRGSLGRLRALAPEPV
jgi:thiamine kinase-like enzyme